MRDVRLTVRIPAATAADGFNRIKDFAQYPDLVDVVRAVTVHPTDPGAPEHSDWEVYFRNGILRWSEQDVFDPEALSIAFDQLDGDFESFSGDWTVRPEGTGCEVVFAATFDFGIPSLAGILDPIAQRVFKETIARVLYGLFDEVEVVGDPIVADALARRALCTTASGGRG